MLVSRSSLVKRLALAVASAALLVGGVAASPISASPGSGTTSSSGGASVSVDKRFKAKKNIRIAAYSSPFGKMLYNKQRQAIYIFEKEKNKKSRCYGDCARGWPPVLTKGKKKGKPKGIKGVKQKLLGTTKRRGGARQVTYNGKPLYYYYDERPGQVFCHTVIQYGANWAVIHPSGRIAD